MGVEALDPHPGAADAADGRGPGWPAGTAASRSAAYRLVRGLQRSRDRPPPGPAYPPAGLEPGHRDDRGRGRPTSSGSASACRRRVNGALRITTAVTPAASRTTTSKSACGSRPSSVGERGDVVGGGHGPHPTRRPLRSGARVVDGVRGNRRRGRASSQDHERPLARPHQAVLLAGELSISESRAELRRQRVPSVAFSDCRSSSCARALPVLRLVEERPRSEYTNANSGRRRTTRNSAAAHRRIHHAATLSPRSAQRSACGRHLRSSWRVTRAAAPVVRRRTTGPGNAARSEVRGGSPELLLDAQELVVLGDPVAAGRRTRLDLPAVRGDGEVGDGDVLGLTRPVGHHRRVAVAAGERDRVQRLAQRADLVDLHQDRVGDARGRSLAAGARRS